VEAAVAELSDSGYLDDARYARMFAQDKRQLEQWGSGRIRRALLARGVEADLIEAALREGDTSEAPEDATSPPNRELGRALILLERRFPNPPSDRRERDRALGALIRRGYDMELAIEALSAYSRPQR
jgi:regulatory protein